MILYGIANCDSVKKALKFLREAGVEVEFVDFRQNPIAPEKLSQWIDELGLEALVNKRSTTYRQLSDEQKAHITETLILKNPTLIKRPVLEADGQIMVGFNQTAYAALIA